MVVNRGFYSSTEYRDQGSQEIAKFFVLLYELILVFVAAVSRQCATKGGVVPALPACLDHLYEFKADFDLRMLEFRVTLKS